MCNLDVVPRRDTALSGYATTLLDPLRRHIVRRSTLAMPPRPASTAPAALALLALLSAALGVDGLGINLGNVLEAPTEGAWAPVAQEYYFDDYASRGFTFVRVPVRWDEHMGKSPPYVIDATFLARVHEVTGWALTRNLSVLINSHHDDWIDVADDGAFQAALPRFQALWTQVAASFASAPTSLFFEVCNEFHLISLANANAVYASVVPIMRAAGGNNVARPIYLGGLSWMSPVWISQNPEAIVWPPLADGSRDANLRLEVHSYDPYHFCLEDPPTDKTWGVGTLHLCAPRRPLSAHLSPPPRAFRRRPRTSRPSLPSTRTQRRGPLRTSAAPFSWARPAARSAHPHALAACSGTPPLPPPSSRASARSIRR